ncbi:hypothetical protein GDO81_019168 [Engystomops pustulosus]|uniref:Gamma-glutamyltransferase 7 n=2 Tax=Engystomops pustulosus TaxID=76066 RepID=A0AAV6YUW5_ENGPU|nr:hypothetical protein GDO81_019168 [Engystomops pustulosus]KAG8540506.1 hypothetical protein GDO81_019168 [Engystomops pustulosus]
MESGGSVVDAGVAAVLCLAVVHPHSVSLGGIFSSIYFNGITQNASVLNAIPHEASPFPYGIPALLQGLWQLHLRHGRKQWSDLFSPAIHLALEGFLVDSSLHTALQENQVKVMSSEGLHALFYDQNILKRVGASVRNLQLGHILEHARTMTDSSLPRELIQKLSGDMKIADREIFTETLSKVLLNREDLVQLHIDGLTLYSSSTPTAGSILINAFQEVYGRHGVNASVSISDLLINVSKTVYTMTGVWPPHITANQSARLPDLSPVGSNVLVADSDGDVVVISLTLNSTFGSGFVCPSTGILLSDFVEGSAPLSFWACPSVLLFGDDNHIMGLASRGGSSIPYTLARVLLHHVLLQMDLTESVNGTVAHLGPGNSDPWSKYLGLDSSAPEMVMAVEVQAEHVHVASGRDCSCYPAGL